MLVKGLAWEPCLCGHAFFFCPAAAPLEGRKQRCPSTYCACLLCWPPNLPADHHLPACLQGYTLPDNLRASGDIGQVASFGEIILMVIPTPFVERTVRAACPQPACRVGRSGVVHLQPTEAGTEDRAMQSC